MRVGVVIDGVRHTRCYSPAGAESDRTIELTVGRHDRGLVSRHLQDVEVGAVVALSQAEGAFTLPTPRPRSILLISGGSGITPVASMLRTLVAEGHDGEVTLLHYAPTAADVPYLAELREIAGAHVTVVLALTRSEGGDLTGHFTAEHLDAAAPGHAHAQTYLCGPQPLMDSVRDVFAARGLDDRLHTEEFAPPVLVPADTDVGGTVTFAASGVTTACAGTSLLEQAESAGLTPEYGCRMGICFSCTTVKTSGCTRNLRTGELDDDPDKHIQLCVTAAAGDVELDL